MTDIFIKMLNMSMTATYVALIVLLVRTFLKKSPKIFSYMLWSVVLFRLICPINFNSSLSLLRPLRVSSNYVSHNMEMMRNPTINTNIVTIDSAVNNSLPTVTPYSSVNPMQILMSFFTYTWILGIALLIIYSIYSYMKIYRRIQFATLVKDNIYETDQITTPFVFGFIRPKIFLPRELQSNEREYIICHERTHIRRFDYLIKPVSFLVLTLHWFNPVMWICYYLMIKDMEMSCDESVLKKSGEDLRGDYSSSLLSLSIKQSGLLQPLAFGEGNIKSRIKNILNYKKPSFWTILIALIIVIAISIGLITNPIDNPAEKRAKEFLELYYTIENTDIVDMIYDLSVVPSSPNINNDGHGIIEIEGIEETINTKYNGLMTENALNRAIANRTILAGEMVAREYGSKLIPESISLSIEEESSTEKTNYHYDIAARVTFEDGTEEVARLQGTIVMKEIDGKWKIDDFSPDRKGLTNVLQFGMPYLYITNHSNASIRLIEISTKYNTNGAMNANNSDIAKNARFDFDMIDDERLDFTVKLLNKDREILYERSFTGDFSKGKDMYLYIEEDELGRLMINRGNLEGKYLSSDSLNWRIMANGNIYDYTGYEIPVEIDESAILGKITSIIGKYEALTMNGQANFDIKDAKYAQFEEDIVVLIDNEWVLFKKSEDMKFGITMSNYGFLMNDLSDEEIFRVFRTISKYIKVDEDYETNLYSIIEKSFKECGIDDSSIIDAAKYNLKITVSDRK